MMTVHHILDTGALYLLHDKHKPALWGELNEAAEEDSPIWVPALVLSEAGQAKRLQRKKLENIFGIAEVGPIDEHVAERAAEGLRAVKRERCDRCSGFIRPSIVDAVVMAFAEQYVGEDEEAVVHTSDMPDMEALREAFFTKITLKRCS
jgi:hypothetical protein